MVDFTAREKGALVLAALETIRLYGYEVVNLKYEKIGGLNASSETLFSDYFRQEYLYIIQTVCAIEIGAGTPQIKLGVDESGNRFIYECGTIEYAEDSLTFVGQLLVGPHDRIYATFEGATAGDTAQLTINGYRVKRR